VARRIPAFVQRTRAHLALSLNAPDDERRARIMPAGRRDDLATLKATLQQTLATAPGGPRDVLVEYVVFDGFNDSLDDADLLRAWLDGLPTRLNLIPANPGPDPTLRTPADAAVRRFQRHLLDRGVRAMVRWPHGRGVGGACGQLAGGARGARI
jgi:23S rRNA (adenine2503-C2)-methyltransferase